jgi:hypothetical protein
VAKNMVKLNALLNMADEANSIIVKNKEIN